MLATIADLMDITGQTYTDDEVWTLNTKLHSASREIQKFTGQKLERQTHIWKPKPVYVLRIPQMPDPVITSVMDSSSNIISYEFDGVETIYILNPGIAFDFNPFVITSLSQRMVITYEAGYEVIPDDLKQICVQMAVRAFGADPLKSGMTQEAITNYSYQQGQAAAAGSIGMLPMEQSSLIKYKRVYGSISMRG